MQLKALAILAAGLFAAVGSATPVRNPKHIQKMRHLYPDSDSLAGLSCESTPITGTILNHGGPIMNSIHNRIYMIYYGRWSNTQKAILNNLAGNIGKSSYFNAEKTYKVTNPPAYNSTVNSVSDNYSQGKSLSDASLPLIVQHAIQTLKLPLDTNGVYFINTDKTVTETGGFCTQYCGFHTNAAILGKDLKYAFIGNPTNCIAGCSPCNTAASPNGDIGVDAMASILSHELMETLSDPLGTTWFDSQGYENADKCAYTYGTTGQMTNGAYYNTKIGTRNYLIQQNWKSTGGCAKS